MLIGLSIRNYIIVSRLDVEFADGFCALTGETGVGKSVIISALQAALGARAEPSCIAPGARSATLTASFAPHRHDHPVHTALAERGLDADDGTLTLRRAIRTSGSSRAFINDQPVTVSTLRGIANLLVEIQNQRASHDLLTAGGQMTLLDSFAGTEANRRRCRSLWDQWQIERSNLEKLETEQETLGTKDRFCRDALAELEALDAQPGEAKDLSSQRKTLLHAADTTQTITAVGALLDGQDHETGSSGGAIAALAATASQLARLHHRSAEILEACQAAERALAEAEEAQRSLCAARERIENAPERLETIEERLFAITAAARKHNANPDELHLVRDRLAAELRDLDDAGDRHEAARKCTADAKKRFDRAAGALSDKRSAAADALARAVMRELPPMRLQTVAFQVVLTERESPGPDGAETITFEVATNPDTPFGPLARIASGGEFSRMALALRLCVKNDPVATLIFDEADAGIGGATAAAVGERLARLASDKQVLAITHSPQVAAASTTQWSIHKRQRNGRTEASMTLLTPDSRTEEIARMISGAQITDQARAAAERLLAGA